MTIDEALSQATISVPDAGAVFFGLARNGAYEAARRGDIPTIRVGGKVRVPVAPVAQMLGLKTTIGRAGMNLSQTALYLQVRNEAARKGFALKQMDAGHFVITDRSGNGIVRATPATLEEVAAFLEDAA